MLFAVSIFAQLRKDLGIDCHNWGLQIFREIREGAVCFGICGADRGGVLLNLISGGQNFDLQPEFTLRSFGGTNWWRGGI